MCACGCIYVYPRLTNCSYEHYSLACLTKADGANADGLFMQQLGRKWKEEWHRNGDERSSLLVTAKVKVAPSLATASGGVECLKTQRKLPAASTDTLTSAGQDFISCQSPTADHL